MSQLRPTLRTSLAPCLAFLAVLCVPAQRVAAQQNDAQKKEAALAIARADSARAELVQPPGKKGSSLASVVRAPFKAFGAGVALIGGVAYGAYRILDKLGAIELAERADRDLKAHGLKVRPKGLGRRSGPSLMARWEGARPLFLEVGGSIRGYGLARGGLFVGDTLNGAELAAGINRFTQLHFWGVGPQSPVQNESDYQHTIRQAGGHGHARLMPHVRVGAGGGWEEDRVGRGNDGAAPDVQDQFAGALPFGSVGRQRFLRADASLDLDFTALNGAFQTRGVRLLGDWSGFRGVEQADPDFQIASTDLRIYAPLGARQAFALRGLAADAFRERDGGVPLYYLLNLGGSEGLRGQKGYRLRDRALLAAMAEWRYQVWWHPTDPVTRVDAFVFVDHGAVGSSLGAIQSGDFTTTPGVGFRFVKRGLTEVETYVAFGGDKPRAGLKLGATF